MQAVDPEFRERQRQVADLREQFASIQGELKQLNHVARDTSKQTIWQFIAFTVAIGGLILGLLNYQNSVIRTEFDSMRNEIRTRFEASEKSQAEFEKHVNQRIDGLEKQLAEIKQR